MPVRIASYNVLADGYIRRDRYPQTPPLLLRAEARLPALIERVRGLGCDVVCMQEVQRGVATRLKVRMRGYALEHAHKTGNKVDGATTISRPSIVDTWSLHYADGDGGDRSGHVALAIELDVDGRRLTIVNTHLRWNPPDKRGRDHIGVRQIEELLARVGDRDAVICGDLNVTADSDVMARLAAAGFSDSFAAMPNAYTCNPNGVAKRIDFIMHSRSLTATAEPPVAIDDQTPLPSATEPSDHIPIVASLSWA